MCKVKAGINPRLHFENATEHEKKVIRMLASSLFAINFFGSSGFVVHKKRLLYR